MRIYIKSILKIKSFNSVHSCSAKSGSNGINRSGFRRGANSTNSPHCLFGREYMFFANMYVSQVNCTAEVVKVILVKNIVSGLPQITVELVCCLISCAIRSNSVCMRFMKQNFKFSHCIGSRSLNTHVSRKSLKKINPPMDSILSKCTPPLLNAFVRCAFSSYIASSTSNRICRIVSEVLLQ
jgi:hypothetical protein